MKDTNADKTLAIVMGAMAGAVNEQVVVEFCRRNLALAHQFLRDCAAALVSAKCVESEQHFLDEIGPMLDQVRSNPMFKVLAERLVKADHQADDELRSCVTPAVWERRVAWLQQAVSGA